MLCLTYGFLAVEGLCGWGRFPYPLLVLRSDTNLILEFLIQVVNLVFGSLDRGFVDGQPRSAGKIGPLQVVTSDRGAAIMLRGLP